MKITLDSNPDDAPGCVKIIAKDGRDLLFQTDYDWPSVASTFGWSTASVPAPHGSECAHNDTDGTVPCPGCQLTAGEFISAARTFLDDHDGATAEDPGYFE